MSSCITAASFTRATSRRGYVRVRGFDEPARDESMKRRSIFSCCTDNSAVTDTYEEQQQQGGGELVALNGGRVAPAVMSRSEAAREQPTGNASSSSSRAAGVEVRAGGAIFLRLAPDNPWLVCRSVDHGGRLFWMHEKTQETTWRQPLPRLGPVPAWDRVNGSMRAITFAVIDHFFFGAPADEDNPKARTGICGVSPGADTLERTCETLSVEHCLYPRRFLEVRPHPSTPFHTLPHPFTPFHTLPPLPHPSTPFLALPSPLP